MPLEYKNKAEIKLAKAEFIEVYKKMNLDIKTTIYLVGSSKRNIVLVEKDNKFDLDFQIIVSHNVCLQPFEIKSKMIEYFQKEFKKNNGWDCDDSTSAITIKKTHPDGHVLYSFDVAICQNNAKTGKFNISKGKGKDCAWKEQKEYFKHKEQLGYIKGPEQWQYLRGRYKDLRIANKSSKDPKKSFIVFIDAVNEVYQKFYGDKK